MTGLSSYTDLSLLRIVKLIGVFTVIFDRKTYYMIPSCLLHSFILIISSVNSARRSGTEQGTLQIYSTERCLRQNEFWQGVRKCKSPFPILSVVFFAALLWNLHFFPILPKGSTVLLFKPASPWNRYLLWLIFFSSELYRKSKLY